MCNQDIVVIEHQPRWKDNTHWKLHRTGVSPDSEPDVNAGRAENLSLSLLLRWGFYCGDLKFTQLKRER